MSSIHRDESLWLFNSCRNRVHIHVRYNHTTLFFISSIPRQSFKFEKNSKLLNINTVRDDVTNIL